VMSANPKEERNYMDYYRLPNRLQNHANSLEVLVMLFVDFLQNLQKSVICVSKTREKEIEICLQNCVNSVKNSLQNLQNLQKSVNDTQSQNRENGSKTAFLAISGENSASRGEGGLGGGVLNPSNSTSNSTVTDVNSTINLKEKNIKKRKENLHNCVKSVKPYSEDFEKVWSFYPRHEGTSKIKAWEAWQKQDMPDLNFLLAVLFFEKDKEQWQDETKIPHLSTWINQRRWEGYTEAKVRASIKYRELCGTIHKAAAPANAEKEREQRELAERKLRMEKLKTLNLPTFEQWAKTNAEDKIRFVEEQLPKGSYLAEVNTEIARRAGK